MKQVDIYNELIQEICGIKFRTLYLQDARESLLTIYGEVLMAHKVGQISDDQAMYLKSVIRKKLSLTE